MFPTLGTPPTHPTPGRREQGEGEIHRLTTQTLRSQREKQEPDEKLSLAAPRTELQVTQPPPSPCPAPPAPSCPAQSQRFASPLGQRETCGWGGCTCPQLPASLGQWLGLWVWRTLVPSRVAGPPELGHWGSTWVERAVSQHAVLAGRRGGAPDGTRSGKCQVWAACPEVQAPAPHSSSALGTK